MRAVFDHSEDENDHIRTFWFRPDRPMRYTAGQFTELTLPHPEPDDRGTRRWFTLSSPPGGELVSITTKRAADHGSSFKRALWNLQPGHAVDLAEAMGDFVLPILLQTPVVFVAGGIGITPFHSIATWLSQTNETRPLRLIHAVQREVDIIFAGTFDKAGIDRTIVVSDPSGAWGGERGHITPQMILGIDKPTDETLFYLSGPEPMVESLAGDIKKAGINPQNIVTDFFPGYSSI